VLVLSMRESTGATRTAVFLFMAAGQLLFAYPARRATVTPRANPVLHVAILVTLVAQALVLTVHPLMVAFDTVALSPTALALVIAGMLASWGFAELVTRIIWGRPACGS
jgi:Ca2+-transporting ATPase